MKLTTTNNKQQTTNNKQQTTNNKQQTTLFAGVRKHKSMAIPVWMPMSRIKNQSKPVYLELIQRLFQERALSKYKQ